MLTSRNPLQRLLLFPIAMLLPASLITTATAQDLKPDPG